MVKQFYVKSHNHFAFKIYDRGSFGNWAVKRCYIKKKKPPTTERLIEGSFCLILIKTRV